MYTHTARGFLIPLLKSRPESGRSILVPWDTKKDARTDADEVPGIVAFDFKLRDGALNATAIIRNNDVFFGWPANVYQTYVLQKYVASKLGCRIGTLSILSCSAHIYEDLMSYVRKVVGKRLQA